MRMVRLLALVARTALQKCPLPGGRHSLTFPCTTTCAARTATEAGGPRGKYSSGFQVHIPVDPVVEPLVCPWDHWSILVRVGKGERNPGTFKFLRELVGTLVWYLTDVTATWILFRSIWCGVILDLCSFGGAEPAWEVK